MSTERKRRALLLAAPIGQDAARIYLLARELRDALEEFVTAYPDAEATEAAASAALGAAGGKDAAYWDASHYSALPSECRGWLFLLNVMGDLLENVAPDRS